MQCENIGTILLKDLFSTPVSGHNEEAVNAENIKQEILQLIQSEDDEKPYNDQKLADLLGRKNIMIARRTVTKYREELNIAKTCERKIRANYLL